MTTSTYLRWTLNGKPMQVCAGNVIKCIGVTDSDGTRGTFFVLDMTCVYYPKCKEEAFVDWQNALHDPEDGDLTWYGSRSQPQKRTVEDDRDNIILTF